MGSEMCIRDRPLVPHFLKQDPHFKLSELNDESLELIDLFNDESSTESQCEVGG